jgi:hypothetical protein
MNSTATSRFWKLYAQLPAHVQTLARKNYELWRRNPRHPSLEFKELRGGKDRFSIRVGEHFRALGQRTGDGIEWVWIGSHEDYNKLLTRR